MALMRTAKSCGLDASTSLEDLPPHRAAPCFSLGDPSESPQTLRIDHEAGGGHEHGWNGGVVAWDLLDSRSGSRGLSLIAATIARLDYVTYNPHDEPQPTKRR